MLYLLAFIGVVFANKKVSLIEEDSIDWWNILNAEVSCCPGHTTAASCDNEGGSSCVFLAANDPIAIEAGYQCVGTSFEKCKAADITACCSPNCKGTPGNPGNPPVGGPDPGNSPVCGPKVTPMPTPQPTTAAPTPACELGVNYQFAGGSCTMSGDPHTRIYNSNKHDFQGTPLVPIDPADPNGPLRNQFYYIHPCFGESDAAMPLKVAGTHYHWGTRSVSGIDHLSVTLTESSTEKYYVYLSSSVAAYADASNTPSDYDIALQNAAGNLNHLSDGTTSISSRFSIQYNSYSNSAQKSWFKITIDGDKDFTVYMQGQSGQVGTPARYRMHYVSMNVPEQLKCFTCGLCGDFNIFSTGATTEAMEGCDGSLINYRAGWNPTYTPEAFDTFGWTWEKYYTDNQCSTGPYDNQNNIQTPVTDPCGDATFANKVEAACIQAIADKSHCCGVIGGNFCDGLLEDCKVDACAGANGVESAIATQINEIIIGPIEAVCQDPTLVDNEEPDPLDFECVVREGSSTNTPGSPSTVSCHAGEVLTSCGLRGVHQVYGTYIDPANPNTCMAGTMVTNYSVKAEAVCCTFTGVDATQVTVSTITSTVSTNNQIETLCPVGSQVTGCQLNIESGDNNYLRGAYSGANQGVNTPPSTALPVDTHNQCVAESQRDATKIRGGAQCLSLPAGFEFDCVATAQYTNKGNFKGNCPA
eukprot:CAMPEP_0201577644 /NCGR_PEP_ID=MMETSP0190_2-20130828/24129_1 /ASSEMBLY_ACC=CAM_ASM_000263 /TAXON_ID=37353 /ORGANISM="Rosalina sp." /LENGTH=698 /DNA_ID=CAMNT_0048009901 /DNA_START=144 /DNA_END=2236 /DNA_ORIENTATION=+